uniref:CCHC-type domain-containing protein n=1 Tax=Tanacetum cinerariifolium TaxID=118510 RepID=A0A6L2NNZ2_TANCI|nr:hypothetical protein [Tanacetum cinerariifolium]
MTNYALWEVIVNGGSPPPKRTVDGVKQTYPSITAKEKLARKNGLKARGTLLMALPNEVQLKLNSYKNSKSLMEAIKKSFRGNKESKKTQKTFLKQQRNRSKWQMAMLTMKDRRFPKKIRRKVGANGSETIGFDKTKVECYNCHKRGHFARKCRAPRENKNKEPVRRNVTVEKIDAKALVAQNGIGYDWSDQAEEGHTNFAFMAYTSSGSSSYSSSDSENEDIFKENIKILKLNIHLRDNALTKLRKKLEKAEKERDEIKITLEKFENSSKTLNKMLDGQVNDKYKTCVGYHAVSPPYTRNFMPPKSDLILMNMDEYIVSEYVTSVPAVAINKAKTSESNLVNHLLKIGYLTVRMTMRLRLSINRENLVLLRRENIDAICSISLKVKGVDQLGFNIDILTKSMNYKPVVVGNQSNGSTDPLLSSSSKDSPVDGFKPSREKEQKDTEGLVNEESEAPITEEPRVNQEKDNVNSTNRVNAVSSTVNAASNEVNAISRKSSIKLPDDPNMPDLEDISIFKDSNEDVFGAEADLNNMETTFQKDDKECDLPWQLEQNGSIETRKMRGIMVRNKARLVAQGYSQEEGIDYDEVFAPVARIKAIRLFLAYASFKDFVVYLMDVKSSFMYGKIEKEVYVCQSLGFEDLEFLDRVYKVEKELYGLHQAPRAWKEMCTEFEKMMHKKFQMSSIGELTFFLGLQVTQNDDGIFISQDKSMIGSLMYLTSSRPDIMFAVCACARFQVTPKVSHLHAMKRIFRYLKGQPKLGLWYLKDSPFDLEAYTDSDYAGACLDRKSTIGGCQFLRSRLISWQCKKQTVVANSTTEAGGLYTNDDWNEVKQLLRMELRLTLAKNINGEAQIHAKVDGKKVIISEATIRRGLKFKNKGGVDYLSNAVIFEQLPHMGYENLSQKLTFYKVFFSPQWKFLIHIILQYLSAKTTAWNEFSSTMAFAIICLATNQKFIFSKYIFDRMVKHLVSGTKFLMYPRVESSAEEKSLDEEDASKQGRNIADIDADADTILVDETTKDQGKYDDQEMFDKDVLNDEEVVETVVTDATTTFVSINDITWTQVLVEIKTSKPKVRGIIMQEPTKTPTTTRIPISSTVQDKGRGIMVEEPLKMKKKDQISFHEQEARTLQAEFGEQDNLVEKKAQEEEQGELTIEEKSRLFVELMVKRKNHFAKLKA